MHQRALAIIATLTLAVATVVSGSQALATWAGSVTDVTNSSVMSNSAGCHGDPYYFKTIYGWTRSCSGGYDIASSTGDRTVYVRGYVWTSAYLVDVHDFPVWDQTCTTQIGTEKSNAWQSDVPPGTLGVGFHHLVTSTYRVTTPYTSVSNGTSVGTQANWGQSVYYCPGLTLASTGAHTHTEAGEVGTNFSDYWGFGGGGNTFPYIHYGQP